MAEDIIVSREQQLEELKSFTSAVNKEIAEIVDALGWTLESVKNVDKEYLVCPYNSSHRLTEASLNEHLTACQWKAEGYEKSDIPLSEPILPADSPFSIKFDEQLQNEVLKKAKEQDPTMQTANYECYAWCWINISFYISFARYLIVQKRMHNIS